MEARVEKLIKAFQENGWIQNKAIDISNDWWFQDIIELTSKWRPANRSLYFTLLTDPSFIDRKTVWSIGISSTIPEDENFTYLDQLTLNDINKIDLKMLVYKINKIVLD